MADTDTRCPECGWRDGLEVRKAVTDDNEVVEDGLYCPDCDSEFAEDATLQWEDIDFPVWIEYESYDDTYGLWRDFQSATGLYDGEYNGELTKEMKYTVFAVYFKVCEDGTVEGPFDEKRGELL